MYIVPFGKTDLGPAANTLVEKIAAAIGRVYDPLAAIIQAHADVQVGKIKAKGEVELEAVRRRALERFAAEETKKQLRLEATYKQALELLPRETDAATIGRMDEDWIVFHSEKARLVSDGEMQTLWAKILVSEAKNPGSFSKRTLEFLGTIEKSEAESFTRLCQYVVSIVGIPAPIVLRENDSFYFSRGITSAALRHLTLIGLLDSEDITTKGIYVPTSQVPVSYFGEMRTANLEGIEPEKQGSEHPGYRFIPVGRHLFTQIGLELRSIAGAERLPDFWENVARLWTDRKVKLTL